LETLLSTVKHEILHALGFSVSLYAYFRDKNGEPLSSRGRNGKPIISRHLKAPQWSDNVIRQVERHDWKVRGGLIKRTVNMIVTPNVVVSLYSLFFIIDPINTLINFINFRVKFENISIVRH
jgi:leishmanolysin-like peptidase